MKLFLTIILFFILLNIGFWIASKKPIWGDEYITQVATTQQLSYTQIIANRPKEGNVCPLFYLIQKFFFNFTHCSLNQPWPEKPIHNESAQIALRIAPVICMSLAITLLFYFFVSYYSWIFGLYALILSLASPIMIAFWAEARPSALWILLTTIQLLIFLKLLSNDLGQRKYFLGFTIVNFLLSFTVIFSAIQITLLSLFLFLFKAQDWKRYITSSVFPLAICLYYYTHTPLGRFWLSPYFWQQIDFTPSLDVLWITVLYSIFLIINQLKGGFQFFVGKVYFLSLAALYFATIIFVLSVTLHHPQTQRNEFCPRYIVHLAPISIVGLVIFSKDLLDKARTNSLLLFSMIFLLGGLLIIRCLKVYPLSLGLIVR